MAGTRRRTAGIHIDGQVATLVLLTDPDRSPKVTAVRQAQGFTGVDALQQLLPLVDDGTPLRVTFSTDGVAATPVDLTAAMLDRAGFSSAARRAFGSVHGAAAIAGVVADTAGIHAGQLATGLAVAAPADVVTSLYRVLSGRDAEVTTCAAAHGALDGLHLTLRRSTSELTYVRGGVPVLARLLSAGGSDALAARLSTDQAAAASVLADTTHDPTAVPLIRAWLSSVVEEVAALRTEWAIAGYDTGATILVSGKVSSAAQLDDLLTSAGFHRQPHPLVSLPFDQPLDAFDAYLASASAGTRLPLSVFHNPVAGHRSPTGRLPRPAKVKPPKAPKLNGEKQRRLRGADQARKRTLTTLGTLVVIGSLTAAGYTTWDRVATDADLGTTRQVTAADPALDRGATLTQLRDLSGTSTAATAAAATAAAACAGCSVTVAVSGTGPGVATVAVAGTDVDAALEAVASDPRLRVLATRTTDAGTEVDVRLVAAP